MLQYFRITYVNPAFAPRASIEHITAHNAPDAVRRFWDRMNPACVAKECGADGVVAIEREVTVIDGRTPRGRCEWRAEALKGGGA